jgi:hypothetical protein
VERECAGVQRRNREHDRLKHGCLGVGPSGTIIQTAMMELAECGLCLYARRVERFSELTGSLCKHLCATESRTQRNSVRACIGPNVWNECTSLAAFQSQPQSYPLVKKETDADKNY